MTKISITKRSRGDNVMYYASADGEVGAGSTEDKAIADLKQTLFYKLKIETYDVDVDLGSYKIPWYVKLYGMLINFFYWTGM